MFYKVFLFFTGLETRSARFLLVLYFFLIYFKSLSEGKIPNLNSENGLILIEKFECDSIKVFATLSSEPSTVAI